MVTLIDGPLANMQVHWGGAPRMVIHFSSQGLSQRAIAPEPIDWDNIRLEFVDGVPHLPPMLWNVATYVLQDNGTAKWEHDVEREPSQST